MKELIDLQQHYTSELTSNFVENGACIIGRSKQKKDVFYFVPWYNTKDSDLTADCCQIMFRVNGFRKNNWTLECYGGGKKQ